MKYFFVFLFLFSGCSTQVYPETPIPSYIDPLFSSEIPDPPEGVSSSEDIIVPVAECLVEGDEFASKTPPGIYMTTPMAMYVGRTKVAYDELRGLYSIDLKTMDREREVYQKQLDLADQESIRLREVAKRSKWERSRGWVGLVTGLVLGIGLTIGVAAAIDATTDAVE